MTLHALFGNSPNFDDMTKEREDGSRTHDTELGALLPFRSTSLWHEQTKPICHVIHGL